LNRGPFCLVSNALPAEPLIRHRKFVCLSVYHAPLATSLLQGFATTNCYILLIPLGSYTEAPTLAI